MNRKAEILEETQVDDWELVKEAQADRKRAFDALVLRYQDRIFNLCYRMLGDYDEANDCAQEAFIKAYNNISSFKFKSSFSTWLYRIAVNTCKNNISSLASRMKRKMVRLDNPRRSDDDEEGHIEISDESSNPAEVFEKKEGEMMVQRAIETLPAKQRMLVVLRDIEGKTYEEIADITGFKQGTVKSKLSRARQELRDKLRGVL